MRRNTTRDKNVNAILKKDGWTVLRYWEHDDIEEIADEIVWVKQSLREELRNAS